GGAAHWPGARKSLRLRHPSAQACPFFRLPQPPHLGERLRVDSADARAGGAARAGRLVCGRSPRPAGSHSVASKANPMNALMNLLHSETFLRHRRSFIVAFHGVAVALCYFAAFELRFDFSLPP